MRPFSSRTIVSLALAIVAAVLIAAPAAQATGPYTLLGGVTATGTGIPVTPASIVKTWTCQVNVSGSPTEVVVALEGNVTGVTYTRMAAWTLTADSTYANGQGVFTVSNMPAVQVRGNLTTLTGGMNPTVTMICTGVQ